jgi:hypothetical protein
MRQYYMLFIIILSNPSHPFPESDTDSHMLKQLELLLHIQETLGIILDPQASYPY